VFIDTFHAGASPHDIRFNSVVAYTASRFGQTSKEEVNLGHGLFTYAVAEGLDGKAMASDKHEITTKGLADYVKKRVEELAKAQGAEQEPQFFSGGDADVDYVLARW
jgi:uncharacterized caspase-like protein